jgi:hypothetical protein
MTESAKIDETAEHITTDQAYTLGVRDMVALHRVVSKRNWIYRRFAPTLIVIGSIVIGAGVAINLTQHKFSQAAISTGYIIGLILFYRLMPIGFAWLNALLWRINGSPGSLLISTNIEASATAIRSRSGLADAEFRWALVKDIVRARDHLFIFVARTTALIVPRRAFASDARFNAFCSGVTARHRDSGRP